MIEVEPRLRNVVAHELNSRARVVVLRLTQYTRSCVSGETRDDWRPLQSEAEFLAIERDARQAICRVPHLSAQSKAGSLFVSFGKETYRTR